MNLRLSEKKKIALAPDDKGNRLPENPEINLASAVKTLYQSKFKPIYLLFDQFEELLILGKETEKEQFFAELQALLETTPPCRIILILREEFIGHLSEYEKLVPALFRHRFRVEKMTKTKVEKVISQTLAAANQFEPPFEVADIPALTQATLDNLPDESREIELVHLQVYLDKLWHRDYEAAQKQNRPVRLSAALISKDDKLQRILTEFLQEQLKELTKEDKRLLPLELLVTMITKEGTKLQRTPEEMIAVHVPTSDNSVVALDLRGKNLDSIPAEVFQMKQLKILLLGNNKLSSIPPQMKELSNLLYLDLHLNPSISRLENLENLTQLVWLDVSGERFNIRGKIAKLEGLDNLKSLTNFDISSNQIAKLEGLDNLKSLTTFDISWNQIAKLEGLDNLKSLTTFDIRGNQIAKLEGLDKLMNLQEITYGGNPISEEAVEALRKAHPTWEIKEERY